MKHLHSQIKRAILTGGLASWVSLSLASSALTSLPEAGGSSPTQKLLFAYVVPNPVLNKGPATLHAEALQSIHLTARFYSVSGEIERDVSLIQNDQDSGRKIFDGAVDTNGLAPGVYVGILRATNESGELSQKKFRFTVIQ